MSSRGRAFAELKENIDLAIEDYSRAIGLIRLDFSHSAAQTFYYRGTAYAQKGDIDSAIDDFNESIKRDRTYVDPYMPSWHGPHAKGGS